MICFYIFINNVHYHISIIYFILFCEIFFLRYDIIYHYSSELPIRISYHEKVKIMSIASKLTANINSLILLITLLILLMTLLIFLMFLVMLFLILLIIFLMMLMLLSYFRCFHLVRSKIYLFLFYLFCLYFLST